MKFRANKITVLKSDDARNGRQVRSLRISKGISLRELARRLDCSAAYVSDLERGRRNWNVNLFANAIKSINK